MCFMFCSCVKSVFCVFCVCQEWMMWCILYKFKKKKKKKKKKKNYFIIILYYY